jgi:hypothetical protein
VKCSLQKRGAEPLASPDDCELAEAITKADAEVQALLKERNITQLDLVACDPWSGKRFSLQFFLFMDPVSLNPAVPAIGSLTGWTGSMGKGSRPGLK